VGIVGNLELTKWVGEIWAKFYAGHVSEYKRLQEMVGMCSPSIGDERGDKCCIFTCSLLFSNEGDIQVGSWPKKRAKWDQKEWKLFSPILEVICKWMCLFSEYTCLFATIASVTTEWMCLFGDNPFWRNRCVCSLNKCVCWSVADTAYYCHIFIFII